MSLLNHANVGTKTTNLAGGQAYSVDPKLELISILLSSFVQDKFYKSANEEVARLMVLAPLSGYKFAAKAASYARNEFGMRSITHVMASEIAKNVKGEIWTKEFFRALFRRPDDMMEVVACYANRYGLHPLPNALKKAIAKRIEEFNEYQLAKYRAGNKQVKLLDLVNLTHPKGNEALAKLMKGELKSRDTWEAKLTEAGKNAENENEKLELKKGAWKELLTEDKLGYLAMLRNCRNIIEQAPELVSLLCERLVNKERISKALIFPFQFLTAMEQVENRSVIDALSNASELSLSNVPRYEGRTLIVVDHSGSMSGKPIEIATMFAGALYKTNDADLMVFSDKAEYIQPVSTDSLRAIARQIENSIHSGDTDFHSIFRAIDRKTQYQRIIILSDMQGWVGHTTPVLDFDQYCRQIGNIPFIYSFDLAGLGSTQFPNHKTFLINGWNEKVFEIMKVLEEDKLALIKKIESINLTH